MQESRRVSRGGLGEQNTHTTLELRHPPQLFLDDRIGSIAAGKGADTAVWDANPMYHDVSGDSAPALRDDSVSRHGHLPVRLDVARLIRWAVALPPIGGSAFLQPPMLDCG
jgi:hypothetical protein